MGKGGESNESKGSGSAKGPAEALVIKRIKKLSTLPTEDLRKWAKAYGLAPKDVDGDKDNLLLALVIFNFLCLFGEIIKLQCFYKS